jgi:uncharacterized protein GlcG (DUF336 family)
MKNKLKFAVLSSVAAVSMAASFSASAYCSEVTRAAFTAAADQAALDTDQFGFGLPMWATMVNEVGKVCHVYSTASGVANTGNLAGNTAWLGSRVISAQKANTANAFSLNNLAISTGGVYVAVQPGGSLYGLQHSNPVDASVAYSGDLTVLGTATDPLIGKNIGGVNVFGGGVALYRAGGVKAGAVGASGDTSCRDHTFAFRLRHYLGFDNAPNDDGLKFVATPAALFESPLCGVRDPAAHAAGGNSDFGSR